MLSGEELPVIACLVRWPDPGRRAEILAKYDESTDARAARKAERAQHGCDVFAACDRYVMSAASPFGT